MSHKISRRIPLFGAAAAFTLLTIATLVYPGDIHWTRVTVSLLCASELPSGEPNLGRALPIGALLILCVSISWLFEMLSRLSESRGHRKTIQIAGIGSMVYAALTVTPMHNVLVNVALAFFLVAILAVLSMLYSRRQFTLVFIGAACIAVKLVSVSLYYANIYSDLWGLLQKVSFVLTSTWLFAVLEFGVPAKGREATY